MRNLVLSCVSLAMLIAATGITGCNKGASQSKEAVHAAITEYLKGRSGLDMSNMEMQVASVSFRDNEAEATVTFNAKGSTDAVNAMRMKYVLEQKGGKWVVKGRSGASEHGGMAPTGELPAGHPPTTPGGKK